MAWISETPGSGGRAASPTVFEQQREELVREIAVVSTGLLWRCHIFSISRFGSNIDAGYGAGSPKHEPFEPKHREHHHSTSIASHSPWKPALIPVANYTRSGMSSAL